MLRIFLYIQLDQNDSTVIHFAIQDGRTSTIEKLVSEGVDLNVQSTDGQTCLHKAIKLCYKSKKVMHETDTLQEVSCTPGTQTRPTPDRRESKQQITLRPNIGKCLESTWSRYGAVTGIHCSSRSLVIPKILYP